MIRVVFSKNSEYHELSEKLKYISWNLGKHIDNFCFSDPSSNKSALILGTSGILNLEVSELEGLIMNDKIPVSVKFGVKSILSIYPGDVPGYILDDPELLDGIASEVEEKLIDAYNDLQNSGLFPGASVKRLVSFPKSIERAMNYKYIMSSVVNGYIKDFTEVPEKIKEANYWADYEIFLKTNIEGIDYLYHFRHSNYRSLIYVYRYDGEPVLYDDMHLIEKIISYNLWKKLLEKN